MMKQLPSDEFSFNFKTTGNKTQRTYDGTFTFKLPNLRTESEIDKTIARLNEGLSLSEDILLLHDIVGYLAHTITEAPEWWKKEALELKIRDFNVYTELRKHCLEFEKKWNDEVWGDDDSEEEKPKEDNKASE